MSNDFLTFRLDSDFVESYRDRPVRWGFQIGGGNSLGELTYISKYSRRRDDGTKERWFETCERVIEGMYTILKNHCDTNRTPWNHHKAQRSAQEAYERMFEFKWTPPGRGLWMMGTAFIHEKNDSSALQNCAMVSTEKLGVHEPTLPFVRLMEMSMLGIGVGFDTRGVSKLTIHAPDDQHVQQFVIPDSREGWCDSVDVLLRSYFLKNKPLVEFDYSEIRPAGSLIKGFGGVAAGPGPLMDLHVNLRRLFDGRDGQQITSSDIVDVMNLVGKCVVSGNVRRSAEIALGDSEDKSFLDLKDWDVNPERMSENGWGHVSNNSVFAEVGGSYDHLVERIANNGEPGLVYLDLLRQYGRLIDAPNGRDYRAVGVNPCAEQSLEHLELCTLVETYPVNNDDLDDFIRTLKFAYLYAKAVTLLPTRWQDTNEVMQRNRRIGCSVSGLAQFGERYNYTELRTWLNKGFEAVEARDRQYSEWLGVRESIKKTSVKPSGTVSLLAGVTPGVHWPIADTYIRRMRFSKNDPMVEVLAEAGYFVEPSFADPDYDVVVEFPTRGPSVRTEKEVSVWEKAALAVLAQRYWADNQVSATFTFSASEKDQVGPVIRTFEGQLKSISFLPLLDGGAYRQMPYERISDDQCESMWSSVRTVNWDRVYDDGIVGDAEGEKFCTNDTCEVKL